MTRRVRHGGFMRPSHAGWFQQKGGGATTPQGVSGASHPSRPTVLWNEARDGEQSQYFDLAPEIVDGDIHIIPGSVPADSFDTTAPALPTGLALSSEVVTTTDGSLALQLVASLVQPSDTDLYASFVQITAEEASPGVASWVRPTTIQIGRDETQGSIEGVPGATLYYARAYSVDVQGNRSAFTATVTHTTVADTVAPDSVLITAHIQFCNGNPGGCPCTHMPVPLRVACDFGPLAPGRYRVVYQERHLNPIDPRNLPTHVLPFTVSAPTPVLRRSWGRLKAIYR